eukprot:8209923-Pyramimonas_sp.AAC.1
MRWTRDALHNAPATASATRESGPFDVSLSAPVKVTSPRAHLKNTRKAPRRPREGLRAAPRGLPEGPNRGPNKGPRGPSAVSLSTP